MRDLALGLLKQFSLQHHNTAFYLSAQGGKYYFCFKESYCIDYTTACSIMYVKVTCWNVEGINCVFWFISLLLLQMK